MTEGRLVSDAVPELAGELEMLLRELGRPDLAEQIPSLRIAAVCECDVEGCASFYTARPIKRWFRRGKQVAANDLAVDTIDGEVVFVEVLGRPGVRDVLRAEVS
jgi:hypothetical protein